MAVLGNRTSTFRRNKGEIWNGNKARFSGRTETAGSTAPPPSLLDKIFPLTDSADIWQILMAIINLA